MEQIAVGLVQQNPLAIPSLERLLRQNKMIVYSNEAALVRAVSARMPVSVFILDIGALTMPFLVYVQQLRHRHPNSKILLLGNKPTNASLLLMLESGVHGFVRYTEAKHSLPKAINAILRNEPWFPLKLVNQFIEGVKQPQERWESLTEREQLIVGLLERRLSNKEIAAFLNVSENTIKFHLSNLFRKLALHDRQSVICAAISRTIGGQFNNYANQADPLKLPDHPYDVHLGTRRRSA